jgi:hypothetical protein
MTDFFTFFDAIDQQCTRVRFALHDVLLPAGNTSFYYSRRATKEIKDGMEVVGAQADQVGDDLVSFMRRRGILVGVVGIVLGIAVFFYALALAGQCTLIANYCIHHFKKLSTYCSYFTLYLLLDIYVLLCFIFFFALITIAGLETAIVAACFGVDIKASLSGNFRVVTAVCLEVGENLTPAIATLVTGGVINFLLSYHMLAALQAAHYGDLSKKKANSALDVAIKSNKSGWKKHKKKEAAVEKKVSYSPHCIERRDCSSSSSSSSVLSLPSNSTTNRPFINPS